MQSLISSLSPIMTIFFIAALGYLVGAIKIKGISLGTAGVLLVALVFGHFGAQVNAIARNIGLVSFVTSVGFIAGPKFFRNFKVNAKSYILLGVIIILVGGLSSIFAIKVGGISAELSVGLLTGALTSTPGLAAAQEAAGELKDLATTGYAIAYPFGVVGVVLFVQLMPRILKVDIAAERANYEAANEAPLRKTGDAGKKRGDAAGFIAFCLAAALGLILGDIHIPLPGGAQFSLGSTGGPLIMGLIFGHLAHVGSFDLTVPIPVLKTFRELGLMLFLIGAGVSGGAGFVETLREEGIILFVYGAIMTLLPMIVGYVFAAKVLKLSLFNNLGSITGGMTSTPALGTLISVAGTDDVASAYAATYPIALVCVVLVAQFTVLLF
ncbi:MAG: permease [Eubacteriales bacterium]|nr:permease [Eubacteriales bacterium]